MGKLNLLYTSEQKSNIIVLVLLIDFMHKLCDNFTKHVLNMLLRVLMTVFTNRKFKLIAIVLTFRFYNTVANIDSLFPYSCESLQLCVVLL